MNRQTPKRKRNEYVDDGHTVYNMDLVVGHKKQEKEGARLTKNERKAAIKAAFAYYLPILFMVIFCFIAVGFLLRAWLIK